jgi:2'-5' RNA ligase
VKLVTSVTIVPPHSVQAVAVPLLRQYAYDHLRRLPAHLTVSYPFVEVESLARATLQLREVCATIRPFSVTVDGYGSFPGVAYMKPRPSQPLADLMSEIASTFPDLTPYEGAFDGEMPPPHVTVGVFNSANKQRQATLPTYPPITFKVDRLYVNVGTSEIVVPWLVHDVVWLSRPL